MPRFSHTLGQRRYVFDDLTSLLAKASPPKSGDQLAGIAARFAGAGYAALAPALYSHGKRLVCLSRVMVDMVSGSVARGCRRSRRPPRDGRKALNRFSVPAASGRSALSTGAGGRPESGLPTVACATPRRAR